MILRTPMAHELRIGARQLKLALIGLYAAEASSTLPRRKEKEQTKLLKKMIMVNGSNGQKYYNDVFA